MTAKERLAITLNGGKADRIPLYAIYDHGYLMKCIDHDIREYSTCSMAERIDFIEQAFLRHPVDGYFVYPGVSDDWVNNHTIAKNPDSWLITDKTTNEQYRLMPDGQRADLNGILEDIDETQSEVEFNNIADIESYLQKLYAKYIEEFPVRFAPLRYMSKKYPDHHFGFNIHSPMVYAVNAFGGYENGLMKMALEPELFEKALELSIDYFRQVIAAGKAAGGDALWIISFYTGADTISPEYYANTIFPYEEKLCKIAHEYGLYTLNWFLGDLMPIIEQVKQLPLDALVLEQGRKGYEIDPVAIRQQIGNKLAIFGFGDELDFCDFNQDKLASELERQITGAGADGAFVVGTPIMPINAQPAAVDFYFKTARKLGKYT
jgi:hypothetical protein